MQENDELSGTSLEYAEYRALCRRVRFGVWPGRVWGRLVGVVRHRVFDGDELRKRYGKEWDLDFRLASLNDRFEIEGRNAGGEWQPLSRWRLDEIRRTRELAEMLREGAQSTHELPSAVQVEAARLSELFKGVEGRKPGLGELVFHLIEHDRQSPGFSKAICEEMISLGWEDLGESGSVAAAFDGALKNGRRRVEVEGRPCRLDTPN